MVVVVTAADHMVIVVCKQYCISKLFLRGDSNDLNMLDYLEFWMYQIYSDLSHFFRIKACVLVLYTPCVLRKKNILRSLFS